MKETEIPSQCVCMRTIPLQKKHPQISAYLLWEKRELYNFTINSESDFQDNIFLPMSLYRDCTSLRLHAAPPNLEQTVPQRATCLTSTTSQSIHHGRLKRPPTQRTTPCPANVADGCCGRTIPSRTFRNVLALFSLTVTFFLATDVFADPKTPFQDTQKYKSKVSGRM